MWDKELDVLIQSIHSAGQAVRSIASDGFEVAYKEHKDPVTTADLAANAILEEALLGAFPDDGWLSEETKDNAERLDKARVWVVDPIDGTKEFVQGVPEYAVSVALVERGIPVLAAVYNPQTDELFTGSRGKGAFLNGKPITTKYQAKDKLQVIGSRSEIKRGEFDIFGDSMEVAAVGSIAYKLALVAAGRADATFSRGPKHEWDVAAGILLVEAAGGKISDKYGKPISFNQEVPLLNSIVASADRCYEEVMNLIEQKGRSGLE